MGYGSWDLNQDKSKISTFHGYGVSTITGPIFALLNADDGSPSSVLFSFGIQWYNIYHIEMKEAYVYATGYWSSLLFIFEFNSDSKTFKMYKIIFSTEANMEFETEVGSEKLLLHSILSEAFCIASGKIIDYLSRENSYI